MSAICGAFSFDSPVRAGEPVGRMVDAMRMAGPDAQTQWVAGTVALGHCLLQTTPESRHERGPLLSPCRSVVLVWDGRLDNRGEIKLALHRLGHEPRDPGDAELALQSYLAWDTDCPSRFLGDFAFAVWDARQRRLFCARDHVGARPLHYAITDGLFAFASLDEALLRVPGVSPAVDEPRVAYFLAPQFQGFDMSGSWHRDIRSLGAGQMVLVHADGRHERRTYWEPTPGPQARFASDEDCVREFLALFDDAVKCRLRASGDIALMLSGGLDSAAIMASADAVGGPKLHTYSAVSETPEDEVENAAIFALAQGRADAHFLSLPSCTGVADLQDLMETARSRPHPVDHSVLLPSLLCRVAAREGQRVMLTGVCGDLATHAAHPHIATLLQQGRWRDTFAEVRAAGHHTFLHDAPRFGVLARTAYHCYAPIPVKRLVRRVRGRHESFLRDSLIHPDFAARLGVANWLRELELRVGAFPADVQAEHAKALAPPHGTATCMGSYNRVGSRWGVEVRDPWADRRVLEFWLRLPIEYKFRDGWTKYLVRRAFADRLPAAVVDRFLKKHVGWNMVARYMAECGPRDPHSLGAALADVDNFVDVAAAFRVFGRYLAAGSHEDRLRMFDVLTLASWVRHCRTFVE